MFQASGATTCHSSRLWVKNTATHPKNLYMNHNLPVEFFATFLLGIKASKHTAKKETSSFSSVFFAFCLTHLQPWSMAKPTPFRSPDPPQTPRPPVPPTSRPQSRGAARVRAVPPGPCDLGPAPGSRPNPDGPASDAQTRRRTSAGVVVLGIPGVFWVEGPEHTAHHLRPL